MMDIDQTVRRMIVTVVGKTEAANTDLDHVEQYPDGALVVGNPYWDGVVVVGPGTDRVYVYAQGFPQVDRVIPGAFEFFANRCKDPA